MLVCLLCFFQLWALLNFLLPEIFASSADFDEMFSAAQTDADVSNNLLAQLHKVLRPFMLRRLKAQVATDLPPKKETLLFVGMSEMQAKLYRGILEKDIEAVLGQLGWTVGGARPSGRRWRLRCSTGFLLRACIFCAGKTQQKSRLMNMVMQLRKAANVSRTLA